VPDNLANLPDFLMVEEVADILRLKRSTAYEYVRQGIIPSVQLGKFIRVPKARIMELAGLDKESTARTENQYSVPVRP